MSRSITITEEAHKSVRQHATNPWRETGMKNNDATWTIPISDETYFMLLLLSLPNESISDCIIRLACLAQTEGRYH